MFQGTVIHGDKIGRTLGYPTANLDTPFERVSAWNGIYAAKVTLPNNSRYTGALIVNHERKKIEVHLLDYTGESLYGQKLSVTVQNKISDHGTYTTVDALKEKIAQDIIKIYALMG